MPRTEPGIRQQRKELTRAELARTAAEMFADRGYDNVTVAEIAAGAGVSVKTLFQYFRSKEDLLFTELEEIHERLVNALRERDREQTPLEAATKYLLHAAEVDRPDAAERFHRMVGDSPDIAALRRRLYDDWETAIVVVLASEANEARPTPRTRLIAAQLISMVRVMSSPEVRELISQHPVAERPAIQQALIRDASDLIGNGLSNEHSPARAPSAET